PISVRSRRRFRAGRILQAGSAHLHAGPGRARGGSPRCHVRGRFGGPGHGGRAGARHAAHLADRRPAAVGRPVLSGRRDDPFTDGRGGPAALMGDSVRGAIIAAGEGSRLRADGFRVPKPMVEVAGLPLIGAVLRNFTAAGITAITVILNEQERECVDWVRARFPALEIDFIVKTTASSLESFREVTGRGPA